MEKGIEKEKNYNHECEIIFKKEYLNGKVIEKVKNKSMIMN